MSNKNPLLSTIEDFRKEKVSLEELFRVATDSTVLNDLTVSDCELLKTLVTDANEESPEQGKAFAYILVLSIEALAEKRGNYNCEEAAILNDAAAEICTRQGLKLDATRCELFKASYLMARNKMEAAFASIETAPEVFRAENEEYALACSLLVRANCRLVLRGDRDQAKCELREAEEIFKKNGDEERLRGVLEVKGKYHLTGAVN